MIAIGDDTRFRQVLEQLLENESKYAPTADGVSIGVWRIGDEVQVYVTDDGPGVPREDWESVFEPFVRIEGRGRSRGSGIGLFAARRLMSAMGGRIFLEPNGFASSRFVVALPAGIDNAAGPLYIARRYNTSQRRDAHGGVSDPRPACRPDRARRVAAWPLGVIWRDIARGGLAGLLVGVVVGGLGGRVAMRLIALLVPEATGSSTENGNRIGDITLGGSFGLILFAGLFVGILVGTIWVVVSPWLPRSAWPPRARGHPARDRPRPFVLVQGSNSDFIVLGFDPAVVVVLLGLVGLGRRLDGRRRCVARPAPAARSVADEPGDRVYVAVCRSGRSSRSLSWPPSSHRRCARSGSPSWSAASPPCAGGTSDSAVPNGRRSCSACWGAGASSRRSSSALWLETARHRAGARGFLETAEPRYSNSGADSSFSSPWSKMSWGPLDRDRAVGMEGDAARRHGRSARRPGIFGSDRRRPVCRSVSPSAPKLSLTFQCARSASRRLLPLPSIYAVRTLGGCWPRVRENAIVLFEWIGDPARLSIGLGQ